ncbi:hypothetical protein [Polaribacter sargassicola]|uniref:hypothetical protein n=1 Tax=Polaribacter sargassicola TaxID=2836891 RepID=UPI001F3D306D|nr:hypothetical protein [Polaribacter sp. DS7-9]MCG1036142.1 hypothetical protein [Polaribacter sp. DS7-9]
MTTKAFLVTIFVAFFFFSCAEDNDITVPRNLQEYIEATSDGNFGEVVACAASVSSTESYIFYYPEEGATDIRYYEADSLNVDPTDFSNYRRKVLTNSDVFGGKLGQFYREDEDDNWCLITYMLNGELHKSNTIRLKNASNPTGWTDEVTIEYPETLTPNFTWSDFGITDNAIYFQVISETEDDTFVSGTYTEDKFFQFYDTSNVVFNINEDKLPEEDLVEDTEYLFTMMGVSEDNWVNLVIQENFILKNLQEYLDENTDKAIDTTIAFAASDNSDNSLTYVYYYPLVGASAYRYYETDNVNVDETDLSNYRRKDLSDAAVYGGKLRRYLRDDDDNEAWCIVTYVIGDVLYKSEPVRIKNQTSPTEWSTDVTIEYPQTLMPQFTWTDGTAEASEQYFEILTDSDNEVLSATFTTDKMFQYYNDSNVTSFIHTDTPPTLIFSDEYDIDILGLSSDNWVNIFIQETFLSE